MKDNYKFAQDLKEEKISLTVEDNMYVCIHWSGSHHLQQDKMIQIYKDYTDQESTQNHRNVRIK